MLEGLVVSGVDTLATLGTSTTAHSDTLFLSRIQFALNISFHILFPTITIALCWILFYFKLRFNLSNNPIWMRAYRFWVKVFALSFALGVVSGVTMSFQFGTNWPGYMATVGNIAGPLLGYEVLTAFFLEATFLGIMLFGVNRVSNRVHTFATAVVAIGTTLSAFWILALNSWMHTPAGFEMRDGVAHATSWWDIIFNPSFMHRLTHMLIASGLTASFLVAGLSAYRILKGDTKRAPKLALHTAIVLAGILAPLQIFVGDLHGLNSFENQPAKISAIEGVWHTEQGAPLLLFALPNEQTQRNDWAVGIPKLASLILTHDAQGEIKGLDTFDGNHPPVAPVFWSFRIMVATGMLMLASAWLGCFYLARKKPFPRLYLKALVGLTFSGWVATLAGWYVTEIGRQPWLVTDILKTQDAVTNLPAGNVQFSLTVYAVTYAVLLLAYIHTLKVMANKAVNVEEFETHNPSADGNLTNLPTEGEQK
ncbi:cytochrome ubiquinol oxidase subunit I [Saccharophagus degradans]|uniref:Cytochrome ubiquinol oxidase subunit I n=1 Tax=Saccharophagus degradans TaxID=86304 RepID=A0AAW7X8X1_9GAMM|nr:cytochrome ubiquinol oxidase subunit I [Saccharophagus degradans]MDO6422938.1 cytochrome ubiquinol oxidase subunit I [Saccharophagus degradans]MDO6607083.1 cytochrome ubiquinol oxidase subunit I [Saccharophagus degradans]